MAKIKIPLDGRQRSLFCPEATWRTPTSLPENLLNFPVVALDTETCDPRLKELGPGWFRGDGKIVGVSLAWADGKIYIPVAHEGGDNFSGGMTAVAPFIIHFLKNFTGTLVLLNGFYDIGWLRYHGLMPQTWQFTVHDVMMVEALIDEHKMRYNMESIAKSYNLEGKDEQLLAEAAASFGVDPKGGMWRLPARFVGGYAEQDASVTLNIYHKQLPIVKEQSLEKVVQLEHSLLPCLMEMRWRGVRVDVLKAEERKREFMLEYDKFMVEIKNESGMNIDVWSADSVALGFKHLSIKYPSTAAGKASFTDDWLTAHPSKFAKLITLARKAHKAANTFCQNMVISQADKNHRVHAEFHPLRSDDGGTVSGRFSCVEGNTLVQTDVGLIKIKELKIGQKVLTHRHRFKEVLATWVKGTEPMLKVKFTNGNFLLCTLKHKLYTNKGWVTLEEIADEYFKAMGITAREYIKSKGALLSQGFTDNETDSRKFGDNLSQCSSRGFKRFFNRRNESTQVNTVFIWKNRRKEPYEGQDWKKTSQLQGGLLRQLRVCITFKRWEETPTTSTYNVQGSSSAEIAKKHGGSSRRWKPIEQQNRQSSVSHPYGTSSYSLPTVEGLKLCKIKEINFGGIFEVYDITVKDDESYASSGVFSHNSSNPNLQQVPARDPRMNTIIRGLFLPEEGEQWAAADYSQQEPRLTIHYAAERKCTRGQEAAAKYNTDPDTDYHNFVASLVFGPNFTPKQRKAAKTINLGLAYGMGGPKLCRSLGYPTKRKVGSNNQEYEVAGDEGQALLDKYFKEVPFIKELSKHYTQQGNNFGYVTTLSGRRCRFTRWEPRYGGGRPLSYEEAVQTYGAHNIKRSKTHTGLNRKIQGGSADCIKIAMRNLFREGIVPHVTIHDEVGVSVKTKDEAKKIAYIMEHIVPLKVPLKVDIDLGDSWGSAKPMEDVL